jgi:hypothetical protein
VVCHFLGVKNGVAIGKKLNIAVSAVAKLKTALQAPNFRSSSKQLILNLWAYDFHFKLVENSI